MSDNKQQLPWWATETKKDVLSPEQGYQRNPITVVIVFTASILVATLAFWGMTAISPSSSKASVYGSVEHLTSITAVLNQCGNIFEFPIDDKYVGVYDPADVKPNKDGEKTAPLLPMLIQPYGFMLEDGLEANKPFYSPKESEDVEMGNVLRSMYDGRIIIWYNPNIIDDDLKILEDYAIANRDTVTTIARDDTFPEGRSLAFATWGASMSCGIWNEDVVEEFKTYVSDNENDLIPSTPPPAVKLNKGKFPAVTMNPFEES